MKIALILSTLMISSIINANEVFKAFDENSFGKYYYIVEIIGNEITYTTRVIAKEKGKKNELVSKGKINDGIVYFTEQYGNNKKRVVKPFELRFTRKKDYIIIDGEKYLKVED